MDVCTRFLFVISAPADTKSRSADVLGHVFEYFLGEIALEEGKKCGQFYKPRSVVELLVKMLEPNKGRIYNPCYGSGGIFVQSEKFVADHQGKINDISIYGQESNQTTWRFDEMELAIRGVDGYLKEKFLLLLSVNKVILSLKLNT